MNCTPCVLARSSVWHGTYRTGCSECTARAIARSNAAIRAFDARHAGDREVLDRLMALAMPEVATDRAERMVRAWWDRDHPATEQLSEPAA